MRIQESLVRVTLALVTPPLLAGMAVLTWLVNAPSTVPVVFGIFAAFLAVIVLFDFPLAIILRDESLDRQSLVRRHQIPWDEIAAIIKLRRTGLVLVTREHKKYVLIDRLLNESERKELLSRGERHGIQIEL